MAGGDGHDAGTGGAARLDARRGVLEDDAVGGGRPQPLGGQLEQARVSAELLRLIVPDNSRLAFLNTQIERELARLELMIACLLPALRNALQYHAAVQSAVRDPLTRLGNRNALELAAGHEIALARRHRQPCSMLVIDLDHFKEINDNQGHLAGDLVLQEFAKSLQDNLRKTDIVCRWGGEEFIVLLKDTNAGTAGQLAEKIRQRTENLVLPFEDQELRFTTSIGIAEWQNGDSLQRLIGRADQALYRAKQSGRNRVCVEPPIS